MVQHNWHIFGFQLVKLLIFTNLDILFNFIVNFVTDLVEVVLMLTMTTKG